MDGEDFMIGPFSDRSDAANLPPDVFDDGVRGEAGLKCVRLTGIDRPDVSLDGFGMAVSSFMRAPYHMSLTTLRQKSPCRLEAERDCVRRTSRGGLAGGEALEYS